MRRASLLLLAALCTVGLSAPSEVADAHASAAEAPRGIALEVLIVGVNAGTTDDLAGQLSGPADAVAGKIKVLESKGQIVVTERFRLRCVENEKASLQLGLTTPVATGQVNSGRGGPPQTSYQNASFGTVVTANAVALGDVVVVQLDIERSLPKPAASEKQPDEGGVPSGTEMLSSQMTVRIANGETVLASGLEQRADKILSRQFVLVSATLLDTAKAETGSDAASADAAKTMHVQVYALRYISAESAAEIIENLEHEHSGKIKVMVEPKTNTIVVSTEKDNHATIETLLRRLDTDRPLSAPPVDDAAKSKSNRASNKYDGLEKSEMQAELIRLQTAVLEAQSAAKQMSEELAKAKKRYDSSVDEDKPEAMLRMIEADAASQQPFADYTHIQSDFSAAKRAYMRLLTR